MTDMNTTSTCTDNGVEKSANAINTVSDDYEQIEENSVKSVKDENLEYTGNGSCLSGILSFTLFNGFGNMCKYSIFAYLQSQITTIEKIFGLSSSKSGLLMSANDIGYLTTVLFSTHVLYRYHIPRVLATCLLICGSAGFIMCLPHFISGTSMPTHIPSQSNVSTTSTDTLLCRQYDTLPSNTSDVTCQNTQGSDETASTSWALILIGICLAFQGATKAPGQALSSTYIDNNVSQTKTGFYLSIHATSTLLGPFIGLTIGGVLSQIPIDLKETKLTPDDPRWLGAWWTGFILFGGLTALSSVPVFCFPRGNVPEHSKDMDVQATDKTVEHQLSKLRTAWEIAKDFPASTIRILSSPVYTLVAAGNVLTVFAIMAYGAFGPKYLETQFYLPTWKANLILGLLNLTTMSIGTLAGGILVRRLKLGVVGCCKLIALTGGISAALTASNFFLGCENQQIIGFANSRYGSNRNASLTCDCTAASYLPVCAGEDTTYFSPCHAGCAVEMDVEYGQCSESHSNQVTSGLCPTDCPFLIPFLGANAIGALLGVMGVAAIYVVLLRSVQERDRALGLGIVSCLTSLLAFIPSPLLYGKLIDSVCLIWQSGCHGNGACLLYDIHDMRIDLVSVDFGCRTMATILTIFAIMIAVKQTRK